MVTDTQNTEKKRPAMEVKNVCFSYGKNEILKGASLKIEKGKVTTIMGANGCGKSTLFSLMTKNLDPAKGKVLLGGKNIARLRLNEFARKVAIVHQYNTAADDITVERLVSFGRTPHLGMMGIRGEEDERYVNWAMEVTNVSQFRERELSRLSGGQRQRVAIARALVNNPEVLLLDEPLGALDLQLRRAMQHELKRLQKKLGITFIYITHDQEEAINMSDTIAVMNHGRFEQIGTPDEIYNHPKTSYVATFVGNANILTGIVESIAEEEIDGTSAQITVRTDAGKVKVSMDTAATSDRGFFPQKGEKVTIAVRSENIRFEENKKNAQQSTPNCTSENTQKSVQEPAEKNTEDSCDGLTAEVIEKTFAGGQLRVVLKTSEGQEIVASRYGIDTNVSVGEKVRCCFLPTDAVLVDREERSEEVLPDQSGPCAGGTHA